MLILGITFLLWRMMLSVHLSAASREGDLRLVGGELSSEGRVEVYHGGEWGTVCDDGWDMNEAQVVCRQLRFPGAQSVVKGGAYGSGSGTIWLDDLDCKGTESSLSSCTFKGWGVTDCTHSEDAGVICEKKLTVKDDRTFPLDHSLGLSGELGALFDSKRDCDLTIVVQSPEEGLGEDTTCIHRLVLSLTVESSIFHEALQSGNLTINVSQDCRSYVSEFLRYLYTREIDVSASSAQCLHKLASDFGIKQLQADTGRLFRLLLPWDSTFHTQASLYQYSVLTGDMVLQESCLQYLAWNCEALVTSPAWPTLSRDTLEALLSRSDLVMPDEAFLLRAVESWARDGRGSSGSGDEAALLRLVRFPMIPPAELYDLPFTSNLYSSHLELYRSGMLRGFQLHALSLAQLQKHLNDSHDGYLPRIYTADPWSFDVNSTADSQNSRQQIRHSYNYNYNSYETVYYNIDHTFTTPVHNSVVLQASTVSWVANVFKTQQECSRSGVQCESLPAVRLRCQSSLSSYESSIRFPNRLLVTCGNGSGAGGGYIFHVQDFKDNLALVPTNNRTGQAFPCYEDSYIYRFVVRPEYISSREGDLRLVGGNRSSEGRVEVYHRGEWGTVCDDGWDMNEAQVVCHQLRFSGAQSVIKGGAYGSGSGTIWLDDLDCKGTESSLSSCTFKGWGVTDCTHSEDAGVICEKKLTVKDDRTFPLDHSLGLSGELGALFDSKRDCDLTIVVQSPEEGLGEDTTCIHRLVLSLSAESPIFREALQSGNLTINVSQDCRSYVSEFLRYLYTREIDVSASSAQCLHKLASDFRMKQLQEDTGRLFRLLLPWDSTFHTQASLYQYSVLTGDLVLQETCLQYLAWNCEALVTSPAWPTLSRDTLEALLSRSDLVVSDEAFLLRAVESWARDGRGSSGSGDEAALLRLVRFPMIPPAELYDLPFTSNLYSGHPELYRSGILRGFQFHALSLAQLRKHLNDSDDGYLPRIYTADPWSFDVNSTTTSRQSQYGYNYNNFNYYNNIDYTFTTPVHNSVVLQASMVSWVANVFKTLQECSRSGVRCESLPAVRLRCQSSLSRYESSIRFPNRLLVTCVNGSGAGGGYIFHVRDFKDNLALIPTYNNTGQAFPCYEDSYIYRFVVRPEYISSREGDLRLVRGKRSSEGRVEVYHRGEWGTVCDDGWDMNEAQVVCRQLGFPGAQSVVEGGIYGSGSGTIWLDDLDCKGTESSLSSCMFKGWGVTDCTHSEDAGVICEKKLTVKDDRTFPLDHSLGLSGELGALFDSKRDCDLTIVVQSPEEGLGEDTTCIHRLVLSLTAESSIFHEALQSGNLTINASQDCRSYVSEFLRYLYTREIDVSASSAQCLHKLASDFGIKQLQADTGRLFRLLLPWDSTFHTQASLYQYSVLTGDLALQETCLQYLAWNCEALVTSPAWPTLSRDTLLALLSRSDLVVPDEAFLLRAVESWARDGRGSSGSGDEAALLRLVRFPMIPPAELYDLPFTSNLYSGNAELYCSGMLRGFQFHALSLAQLRKHLNDSDDGYLPRIYTADPWSFDVNSTADSKNSRQEIRRYSSYNYNYNRYETVYYNIDHNFTTPVHNSVVLQDSTVSWVANVFKTQQECSRSGVRCESLPAVRLRCQSSLSSIRFPNRLLVTCVNGSGAGGGYIFHVQDFKDNLALIPTNNRTGQAFPCYEDSYIYRFVVRPEYIWKPVQLRKHLNDSDDGYLPRIYTADPWSFDVNSTADSQNSRQEIRRYSSYNYNYNRYETVYYNINHTFTTPVHNSEVLQASTVSWVANVFKTQQECSRSGVQCESLPAVRLRDLYSLSRYESSIRFPNRLLVTCGNGSGAGGGYIFHVRDFKDNLALIPTYNNTGQAFPCYEDSYVYRFVVRPEKPVQLRKHLNDSDDGYLPRIYTADPWSFDVNSTADSQNSRQEIRRYSSYNYNYNRYETVYYNINHTFTTPVHNSEVLQASTVSWVANVFKTQQECSRSGVQCESLPAVRLRDLYSLSRYESSIRFPNCLLVTCGNGSGAGGGYIFHVRDFKDNLALIPTYNNTGQAFPCYEDSYVYRFVAIGSEGDKWKMDGVVSREGDLRLVGSNRSSEGRVEVYHGGEWGTVCDDGWDMNEAQVVCRLLGFSGAQSVVEGGIYGSGSGTIWLDDLDCKGTESSLSSCTFKGWGVTDCTHSEDAGVICEKQLTMKDGRTFPLDHSLGLSGELGALFDSKRDCDLTIVVQSPEEGLGEDTTCIHRLVLSLSAESPIFREALQSGNLTINVSQDCRSYVSEFLRYLYTREISISASSAQCLHKLASDFGIKQLQADTGRLFRLLLPWDSTFHTQASLYQYSVLTGDLALQETCLQYLAWNFEALVTSSAWPTLSRDTLEALLSRSDLVVPDEAFLLRALESWAWDGRGSSGSGDEAVLLRLVRFPMIPPAELYDLPFTSNLYSGHPELYRSGMLRGFQLHALSLAQLRKHLNDSDDGYLPRIYTADPWSFDVNSTADSHNSRQEIRRYSSSNFNRYETVYYNIDHNFTTPVHNSVVLQDSMVSWVANVFKTQQECSRSGVWCESLPAVRLRCQSSLSSIRFPNRLLVTCVNGSGAGGGYIFHVQDFKDNLALIPTNNRTGQAFPCYEDSYIYRFVVRPEYTALLSSSSFPAVSREGDLRLVGSNRSSEGRVEVYHGGEWGTVCDDGWDMNEAQVVCRQLGFPGVQSVVEGGAYGSGSGTIWLDDLDCKGTESSLSSCAFKGWGVTDCTHSEDTGVICEKKLTVKDDRTFPLDHSLGLSGELGMLFDSKQDCDLIIVVQSPEEGLGEDTTCIHRLVLSLSAESSIFQSGNLTINVSQDCRSYVSEFLRYLYTREIDVSASSAQCLHKLASDFGIKQLQADTGRLFRLLLPWDSTFHTQASLYQYSVLTGDLVLQETCLQYLAWNCEALVTSPAWPTLSRDTLEALLSRSDLVVPDEAFLLRAVESWAQDGRGSSGSGDEAALLRLVRFPMIPPAELYDLPFTSNLYSGNAELYVSGMLRGFQFHALSLTQLQKHLNDSDDGYLPRIYTADPWSFDINSTTTTNHSQYSFNYYNYMNIFITPVHNSMVLQAGRVIWGANVFKTQQECSRSGVQCESLPAVRLRDLYSLSRYESSIRFPNRLLVTCGNGSGAGGGYIFQVQDFKENLALIRTNNRTGQAFPCYEDSYIYRFVVRPEYI
ncbi:uncharacterized protein LOC133114081 [Conger conger]|uniref:uncharacterized protein LOC133114081 n=1 Tax=Conger conger TaxID=82655 RepID=UPI002A598729|nr:uncharacterized protein LOC133114081 [Conger conger]